MSHFYGTMQGNRGETSRGGSATSGIVSHTRGWNLGVEVVGYVDSFGNDCFNITATGGSHSPSTVADLGAIFITASGDICHRVNDKVTVLRSARA